MDVGRRRQCPESLLKRGHQLPVVVDLPIPHYALQPRRVRKLGTIHSDTVKAAEQASECAN